MTHSIKKILPFHQILYIVLSLDSNDQFSLQLNDELKINNLFAVTDVIYLYIRMFFQHNIILSEWIHL